MPPPEKEGIDYLRRELYARDEPAEITKRVEEISKLGTVKPTLPSDANEASITSRKFENLGVKRAAQGRQVLKWSLIGVGIVLVVAGLIGGTWWYRSSRQVVSSQIVVTLQAPGEVTSGQDITYTLTYRNDSLVSWDNVEVNIKVPRGFMMTSSQPPLRPSGGTTYALAVGTMKSKQEGTVLIKGHLLGEQDASALAEATLVITPSNFPSGRFTQSASVTSTITSVPLEIKVEAARDVATGERARMVFTVRNLGTVALPASYLKLTSPPGVQLASDDAEFSPDFSDTQKQWLLPTLEPLQETSRVAIAYVQGRPGDQRPLEIESGIQQPDPTNPQHTLTFVQRRVSHIFVLATAELFVEQVFKGATGTVVAKAGEEVTAKINYQNVGTRGLKDVVITAQFEGTGIDFSRLKLSSGGYDPRTKKITWTASTVPELSVVQPQESGTIELSFHILPTTAFPTSGEELKNFTVISTATIDSPDISNPVGQTRQTFSDRLVLSVASELALQVDAFYDDGRLGLTSTGPLPPMVGQETTYTARLRLGSTLNDMSDVRVLAVLPDNVKYTNKTYLTAGTVDFNDRTGEVLWKMPTMAAGTGRLAPAPEFNFQIAITPGENQRGQYIPFLNKVKAEATDDFTDTATTTELQTFPTTETAAPGKGAVQ